MKRSWVSEKERNTVQIREITYIGIAIRIVVASILGGAIGLERGLKNRPAGLRWFLPNHDDKSVYLSGISYGGSCKDGCSGC